MKLYVPLLGNTQHLVREDGELHGDKETSFHRKLFWAANNFGVLRARIAEDDSVAIVADLYGDTQDTGAITRKRTHLI